MITIATREGVRDQHVVVPFAGALGAVGAAGAGQGAAVAGQGAADAGQARQAARLSFDTGLSLLDLQADADLDDLLDARFADPLPVVWAADYRIHVEYPLGSRLRRPAGRSTLRISSRVPWAFDVHGGADRLRADLTGADVRSIAVHAGAAHTALALGRPSGHCTIRFASVKDLRIERPAGVPVRLEIAKGATNVVLDSRRFGAVGGGLTDQTSGYERAGARYLVVVAGGADTVTITQRAEEASHD